MSTATTTPWVRWRRLWGNVLEAVSVVGTVLAVLADLLLALLAVGIYSEMSGETDVVADLWVWGAAVLLVVLGIAGLALTSRTPVLAYALRIAVAVPFLGLGLVSFWFMLAAVLFVAANISLALGSLPGGEHPWVRLSVAAFAGLSFVLLAVPFVADGCQRPRQHCEYESLLGWGAHDSQQVVAWVCLAVIVVALIGHPVADAPSRLTDGATRA